MKSKHWGRMVWLVGLVWAVSGLSVAAEKATVTASLVVFRVVRDAEGKEQLEAVEEARPGDLLEYQLTYANPTRQAVKGLQATLPLPEGLAYQARSAEPGAVQASLDGEKFAAVPLRRQVKGQDGKVRTEEVPTSEYRALRWRLATLGAGESVTCRARVAVAAAAR